MATPLKKSNDVENHVIHNDPIHREHHPSLSGKREFSITSEAWYGQSTLASSSYRRVHDEIVLGVSSASGGTTGEMIIQWVALNGEKVPRLMVFDDSWKALASMKDVIDALAELNDANATPQVVAAILKTCGFTDVTARSQS